MAKPDLESVQPFIEMFGCDTARISKPCGKLFLILGWNRHTKDAPGQWYRNGESFDFPYVAEQVVASGKSMEELRRSAEHYKQLLTQEPRRGKTNS